MNKHTLNSVESFRSAPVWTLADDDDDDDDGLTSSTWVENYMFNVHDALDGSHGTAVRRVPAYADGTHGCKLLRDHA